MSGVGAEALTAVFTNIGNTVIIWKTRAEIGQKDLVENQGRQTGLNTRLREPGL